MTSSRFPREKRYEWHTCYLFISLFLDQHHKNDDLRVSLSLSLSLSFSELNCRGFQGCLMLVCMHERLMDRSPNDFLMPTLHTRFISLSAQEEGAWERAAFASDVLRVWHHWQCVKGKGYWMHRSAHLWEREGARLNEIAGLSGYR
jgi:hypothetical protein